MPTDENHIAVTGAANTLRGYVALFSNPVTWILQPFVLLFGFLYESLHALPALYTPKSADTNVWEVLLASCASGAFGLLCFAAMVAIFESVLCRPFMGPLRTGRPFATSAWSIVLILAFYKNGHLVLDSLISRDFSNVVVFAMFTQGLSQIFVLQFCNAAGIGPKKVRARI
jgi:hypothetical protein